MTTYNPRVDFAFKKLFGSEENKASLMALINSILPENEHLTEVTLQNPFNDKEHQEDKYSVLDIKAKDAVGRYYNIEMQVTSEIYYSQRVLYYWSKLYASQLLSGYDYNKLQKTISIHLLNFNCFKNESDYHNVFHILNAKSHRRDFEDMELHFIELQKFDKDLSELTNRLDYWTTFLTTADQYNQETMPDVLKNDPEIGPMVKALEHLYLNEAEREIYEARLKWLRDESSAVNEALKKGMEKGHEEGLAEGMEKGIEKGREEGLTQGRAQLDAEKLAIARKLREAGLPSSVIAQSTVLSIDTIEALE
jgi:predicted transposase/invertase (TIGR01784 family)